MLRIGLRLSVPLLLLLTLALPGLQLRIPTALASPAAQAGCFGDEMLAFNPYGPKPAVGQDLYIIASSVHPSTFVDLSGPLDPAFAGAGNEFRQRPDGEWEGVYTWTWKVTPVESGTYTYTFTVDGVTCVVDSVVVGDAPLSPESDLILPHLESNGPCNGDEMLAFNPYGPTPGSGRDLYIVASSAHPLVNVELQGPLDPVYGGVGSDYRQRPDGEWESVFTWTWKVVPPIPDSYDYTLLADGAVCAADTVQVRDTTAALQ